MNPLRTEKLMQMVHQITSYLDTITKRNGMNAFENKRYGISSSRACWMTYRSKDVDGLFSSGTQNRLKAMGYQERSYCEQSDIWLVTVSL